MSNAKERLYLFDTTLRDGAQTAGIEFSLEDKIAVARLLEELGVDYIEGGYPGANVVDDAFFAERAHHARDVHRLRHDQAVGPLGRQRSGRAGDRSTRSADAACFVAKTWDKQVELALGVSPEENLKNLRETVEASVAAGKETLIDCEHFFDGYKANPDYALACVEDGPRCRRALDRALRHQWRHHAGRGRGDRPRRC